MKVPFDLSRAVLEFADRVSSGTLTGVRDLLTGSMQWTAAQLEDLSRIAPGQTPEGITAGLNGAIAGLRAAEGGTGEALTTALAATGKAFETALQAVHLADDVTQRTLFENLQISSVVGESFAGLVTTSKIKPAFRLITNGVGVDASIEQVAADYKMFRELRPKQNGVVICVPGLFCDEGLWEDAGVSQLYRDAGVYPVYLRFNPGVHISNNGRALHALLGEYFAHPQFQDTRPDVLSYSQGGLILRSMLYYDGTSESRLALNSQSDTNTSGDDARYLVDFVPGPLARKLGRVVSINTPDGGSYLEKLGYWLGVGMQAAPLISLKAVGFIGNQRSDAIKDLSHGIIREEDWQSPDHNERYNREYYFGELDHIDAYQIYSLVSETDGPWESWLGDGVVEKSSLTLLSDKVYRKKPKPETRVYCLFGKSHFQVVQAPETRAILSSFLQQN